MFCHTAKLVNRDLSAYTSKDNTTKYRFLGLNNEIDYTYPYAYLYAGKPWCTQQLVRTILEYRFSNTKGGLPGNDDSGSLSSWYVWNSMGLFPVIGQDLYLIGSPKFKKVSFSVGVKPFNIVTANNNVNNIYIQSATLNGQEYNKPFLLYEDLEKGGDLKLIMGDTPSRWGADIKPPSYSIKNKTN